jgi:hypothetical protein
MVPGLGFLYSGLARRKSALSLLWAVMGSCSVITFQWYLWGYSLAFSPSGSSGFIGDLQHFGLRNTLGNPSPGSPLVPDLLYAFYQVRITNPSAGLVTNANCIRCNSAPSRPPLSSEPSQNEDGSSRAWYLPSSGQLSSTAPSPAGRGTLGAGASSTESWITLVAGLSKSAPACRLSRTQWSWADGRRR